MNNWIRTESKLPSPGVSVLCKQIHTDELFIGYILNGWWKEFYENLTLDADGVIDDYIHIVGDNTKENYLRITHWLPLPEPPQ